MKINYKTSLLKKAAALTLTILTLFTVATASVSAASKHIGVSKAKSIALADARLKSSAVTFTEAKLDTEDGIKVYEVEFKTSSKKYEYEINAKSGKILEKEINKIKNEASASLDTYIGLSKAKSVALADAGLNSTGVIFTKAKLDTEDGVKVYEVEFKTSSKKYEYEINAKTGKILEKEVKKIKKK